MGSLLYESYISWNYFIIFCILGKKVKSPKVKRFLQKEFRTLSYAESYDLYTTLPLTKAHSLVYGQAVDSPDFLSVVLSFICMRIPKPLKVAIHV